MFCLFIRRKLPLYMSDDLPSHVKRKVVRHVHTCRRCRVELNRIRSLRNRLSDINEVPPPDALNRLTESIMEKVSQVQPDPPAFAPKTSSPGAQMLRFRRVILAGLLVIFSVCAVIRYTWLDALLTSYELKRSVVTRDGLIVSDARLHDRDADVKVVKDDTDMLIIWLISSPVKQEGPRRG